MNKSTKRGSANSFLTHTKLEKGITLVALIITIVVLLILAVVSIGAVKNSRIISHAQETASKNTVSQEKEHITLALNEWQLQKNTPNNTTSFKTVIETALQNEELTIDGEEDGPLTVTFKKTKNQYLIYSNGTITKVEKGISLNQTSLEIVVGGNSKITATLLGGLSGEIRYSSSDETKVSVNENGDVSGVAEGKVTITVTCEGYTATCEVTVQPLSLTPKAYKTSERTAVIITPENKMCQFKDDDPMAISAQLIDLNANNGEIEVELVGFEGEDGLSILYYNEAEVVFVLSKTRDTLNFNILPDGGGTKVIITKGENEITHNEELLTQYYKKDNSENCEYYYGEWNDFEQNSGVTTRAGRMVIKVDYNNETVTAIGTSGSNWDKNAIVTYSINEISDVEKVKINDNEITSLKKIVHDSGILFVKDSILYVIVKESDSNEYELRDGWHILEIEYFVNDQFFK